MVQIIWLPKAEAQLLEIGQYIARNSSEQAIRVTTLIRDSTEVLEYHPEFGAVVPEFESGDFREIRVYHFRILYRIEEDGIHVVLVVHGAMQLSGEMIE